MKSTRRARRLVAGAAIVALAGVSGVPTVEAAVLGAPTLSSTSDTALTTSESFPVNGATNDRITRLMTLAIPTSAANIPDGTCVRLLRAPADATGTPTGPFEVTAGGTKSAPSLTNPTGALTITDNNRGGKLPDGRYLYQYDVIGLTGTNQANTQIVNDPALDTPACNHTAAPKNGTVLHTSGTSLPIVYDTVVEASVPDLFAGDDTGRSSTDNVTFLNTNLDLTVTGEDGSKFDLYRSGTKVTSAALGMTRTVTDAVLLTDDGNAATDDTVVTSATAAFVATDAGKAVTGVAIPDGTVIASVTNATTAKLSKVPAAGGSDRTITIVGTTVTDAGGASAIPTTGNYLYRANVTDLAGNTASFDTIVRIDLDNPVAPVKLDLVPASDTGTSDADDITNDATPTFAVTGAEDDALVELFACEGANCGSLTSPTITRSGGGASVLAPTPSAIGTRVGNGEITADDKWWEKNPRIKQADNYITKKATDPLAWPAANTSWRFNVRQTDLSGRMSCTNPTSNPCPLSLLTAANTVAYSVDVNVVVDTTPLDAPTAPRLVPPGELSIASSGPDSDVSPTFEIDDASGRVELLRDGKVVASRTAAGRITDPGPLANGTYIYTARSVDTAGNVSPLSPATSITVEHGGGYWLVGSDGGVFAFGDAGYFGSTGDRKLNAPVLGVTPTPSKKGYWLLAQDGGVFAFGDAGFFGSTGDRKLNQPILGMVATRTGNGYWLFAPDGGVFAFGDAPFHGAPASSGVASPIVAMVATPDGRGYWLISRSGKVYAYGTAAALAGLDGTAINAPIVGAAAAPSGKGLYLLGSDGGVFTLGDAAFHGSTGGMRLNRPIIAITALPAGNGYYLLASDGGVFTFGRAVFHGSTGSQSLNKPIVGMSAS